MYSSRSRADVLMDAIDSDSIAINCRCRKRCKINVQIRMAIPGTFPQLDIKNRLFTLFKVHLFDYFDTFLIL